MNYLKAVLRNDNESKIEELKKLIVLGEKLNKNTTPDKKKLEILSKREKTTTNKTSIKKIENKTEAKKEESSSNVKYAIDNVYISGNKIIIDFNVDVSNNDIKYFMLKQKDLTKNVFDINGYFKDAAPTKLEINGVEKIVIGQFKPNILRIVLANSKDLKTSYKVLDKQIIITIDDLETNYLEQEEKLNPYVDKKNSIRSITTKENKIFVRFNKDYSLKDIKYTLNKKNKIFEDTFDIKGKFEFTKPTVLKTNLVDKTIVTDFGNNNVRIRLRSKNDLKVSYALTSRELIITVNEKEKKPALPYPNYRPRTIVIDAGHGDHDVGAVGPNKRYEKVVTLNVAKYLYSILKQRGHKVYLTRYNDKFIKVKNRTILANDKNADIFISVHANSVPKSKANDIQGIETFFLSPARSERAKRVAAIENKEDITNMSSSSKSAFLESLNRPRITASHKLAIDVQAGLLQSVHTKYKDIGDSGVREGPFWVLVGAQMPSILIELGYISHPIESKRLYNKEYQQLLANGIANGVDSYFSKNP